jgi:hypothetical protein
LEERRKIANEMLKLSESNLDIDQLLGPSTGPKKSLKTPGEKLTNYHIFVDESVCWGSPEDFLKLIQSFLLKEIDRETFSSKFIRLRGQNMIDANNLCVIIEDNINPITDLNYTSKAFDFGFAISALFFEID